MERKGKFFTNSNTTFAHVFHCRTEMHDVHDYITLNVTILYYSYTCVQYLDVQINVLVQKK